MAENKKTVRKKSGIKRVRSSAKRKLRNFKVKESIKKSFKAAEKAIAAKAGNAKELVKKAVSIIDRAAKRGVIHKNKINRKKSRLLLKLNKAKA